MSKVQLPILLRLAYEEAAQQYLRSLPPEHFMEATSQATQRKITLASLELVHAQRPEIQIFNELLVQYRRKDSDRPGQVVPDNMIVLHPVPSKAVGSFMVPLEKGAPFCMLEYVSNSNKRKDYDDNMYKYEHELRVPYYLLFFPDAQELTLYRHNRFKYVSVKPNKAGRLAIPKLELEVAVLDDWVRYWFRGELLPLPADMLRDLVKMRKELKEARGKLSVAALELDRKQSVIEAMAAEMALLRAQLEQTGR